MIAPPPPPTTDRPVALCDTECYPNYWLLKFRTVIVGQIIDFELRDGEVLTTEQVSRIKSIFNTFTVVTFNGNYYDIPMIGAAMINFTPAMLNGVNNLIIVENRKPWELGLPEWKPIDHIDIIEVLPGAGSQKQYAGRQHCRTMRDLPYDPSVALSDEQMREVNEYCGNDLAVLGDLFNAARSMIHLRETLGERYGIDLRSKSDAQLAETVIKARCEAVAGCRLYKPPLNHGLRFTYRAPEFIAYSSPPLQAALALVKQSVFCLDHTSKVQMPPQLDDLHITIGGSTYAMGLGGLHSTESKRSHVADDDTMLLDIDVESYYPSLMLNSGEYPPALGPTFLQEFGGIKSERLDAKHEQKRLEDAGDTASPHYVETVAANGGGKIMINGTFGKTASPHSILFAPQMMIQTTLTGQLSLVMLIEWLECNNIPVVSANTDGVVVKAPRSRMSDVQFLIKTWETRTGLLMEINEYAGLYSRDVNSYFAVKAKDRSVKRKGEYAKVGWQKNPDSEICADAVAEFLAHGTPIEATIISCMDIRKFVTVRKVGGGAIKFWGIGPKAGALVREMEPVVIAHGWIRDEKIKRQWYKPFTASLINSVGGGTGAPVAGYEPRLFLREAYDRCFETQRQEFLGKVVRWYYGTRSPGPIRYATSGNTVSLSEGAQPCMTLPDTLPNDIDYAWYVRAAYDMLNDCGYYSL